MKTFKELLIELDACKDAIEWAGEKTVEQCIATCDKGDWIGWLADRIDVDKRLRTLAAGHAVNTLRHLMRDSRSTEAVDAAIAYGEGRITEDELEMKAGAAWAAYWAARAAWAAQAAAWAARAAEAAEAARAAGEAAEAAARAAGAARPAQAAEQAARMEYNKINSDIANIYRTHMGQAIINKVNQLITEQ